MPKEIVTTIKEYLKETSIHGFKYLGQETSIISKLFWFAAVSCCFTAAYQSYKMAMIDWDDASLVTTIESIDTVTDSIQFPTITLCAELRPVSSTQLTLRFINGLKFHCKSDDVNGQSDCRESQKAREVISPMIWKYLAHLEMKHSENIYKENCNLLLYTALERNITSPQDIKTRLVSSVGKAGAVENILTWLQSQLPEISLDDVHIHDETCEVANILGEMMHALKMLENAKLGDIFNAIGVDFTNPIYVAAEKAAEHLVSNNNDALRIDFTQYFQILHQFGNDIQLKDCKSQWQKHIYDKEAHPCDIQTDDKVCCNISISPKIEVDRRQLMTIHKFRFFHTGYELSPQYLMSKLNITDTMEGFPLKSVGEEPLFAWNYDSILPSCIFGKVNVDYVKDSDTICKLLSPVPTNMGICYAFNADTRFSPKKCRKYDEYFRYAFEAELEGPQTKNEIYKAEKGHSFVFVFSTNTNSLGINVYKDDLLLRVTDKHSFFNLYSEAVKVSSGYLKTITVRPVVKRSYGIEHMPLSKRKCRFSHEVIDDDYSIFDFYSMESCIQECRVAFSIETCRCIPWDMPFNDRYDPSEYRTCLHYGSDCFTAVVQNASIDDLPFCRDRCISNCNTIKFEMTHQESKPLNEMDCFDSSSTKLLVKSLWQKYHKMSDLLNIHRPSNKLNFDQDHMDRFTDWCWRSHESDVSVVEVKVDFSSLILYRQVERIDLIGKISSLGGILGIFTGMSFLSMVEIVFWTIRTAVTMMVRGMRTP